MPVNNPLERIIREIRRRTRVVGAFPDGQFCLNVGCGPTPTHRVDSLGKRRYMIMEPLLNPAKQAAAA